MFPWVFLDAVVSASSDMQQLGLASALPSFCTKCLVWSLRLEKEQPTANHHRAASVVCSSFTLARQLRASSFYPLDCLYLPAPPAVEREKRAPRSVGRPLLVYTRERTRYDVRRATHLTKKTCQASAARNTTPGTRNRLALLNAHPL